MRQNSWPVAIALPFFSLGKAAEGNDNLEKYNVTAPGITASYIAYGARLTNLYVDDKHGVTQDVVLGYDQGSGYVNDTENEHTYFGAVSEFSSISRSISTNRDYGTRHNRCWTFADRQ